MESFNSGNDDEQEEHNSESRTNPGAEQVAQHFLRILTQCNVMLEHAAQNGLGSGPINFAFTVFGDDVPIIHGGTSYERSFLADAGATETH